MNRKIHPFMRRLVSSLLLIFVVVAFSLWLNYLFVGKYVSPRGAHYFILQLFFLLIILVLNYLITGSLQRNWQIGLYLLFICLLYTGLSIYFHPSRPFAQMRIANYYYDHLQAIQYVDIFKSDPIHHKANIKQAFAFSKFRDSIPDEASFIVFTHGRSNSSKQFYLARKGSNYFLVGNSAATLVAAGDRRTPIFREYWMGTLLEIDAQRLLPQHGSSFHSFPDSEIEYHVRYLSLKLNNGYCAWLAGQQYE